MEWLVYLRIAKRKALRGLVLMLWQRVCATTARKIQTRPFYSPHPSRKERFGGVRSRWDNTARAGSWSFVSRIRSDLTHNGQSKAAFASKNLQQSLAFMSHLPRPSPTRFLSVWVERSYSGRDGPTVHWEYRVSEGCNVSRSNIIAEWRGFGES